MSYCSFQAELFNLVGSDEPQSSPPKRAPAPTPQPPPRAHAPSPPGASAPQAPSRAPAPAPPTQSLSMTSLLSERMEMYQQAISASEQKNETSKVRRYRRAFQVRIIFHWFWNP